MLLKGRGYRKETWGWKFSCRPEFTYSPTVLYLNQKKTQILNLSSLIRPPCPPLEGWRSVEDWRSHWLGPGEPRFQSQTIMETNLVTLAIHSFSVSFTAHVCLIFKLPYVFEKARLLRIWAVSPVWWGNILGWLVRVFSLIFFHLSIQDWQPGKVDQRKEKCHQILGLFLFPRDYLVASKTAFQFFLLAFYPLTCTSLLLGISEAM